MAATADANACVESATKVVVAVKGLSLCELEDGELCCGFGGTFAVKFPMIRRPWAMQKLQCAMATKADYIVSNDSSCLNAFTRVDRPAG